MSGSASIVVTCPNCQGPVEVELHLTSRPLQSVGNGTFVVTVSAGEIRHECPPPPAREPLERAA